MSNSISYFTFDSYLSLNFEGNLIETLKQVYSLFKNIQYAFEKQNITKNIEAFNKMLFKIYSSDFSYIDNSLSTMKKIAILNVQQVFYFCAYVCHCIIISNF